MKNHSYYPDFLSIIYPDKERLGLATQLRHEEKMRGEEREVKVAIGIQSSFYPQFGRVEYVK